MRKDMFNLGSMASNDEKKPSSANLWGSTNKNIVDVVASKFPVAPATVEGGEDVVLDIGNGYGKTHLVKFTIHMECVAVPYKKKDGSPSIQLVADTSDLHIGTALGFRLDGMPSKKAVYARGLNLNVSEMTEENGVSEAEKALAEEKAKNAELAKKMAELEAKMNALLSQTVKA